MKIDDTHDFDQLSVPDKIQLVQDLWDRIASTPGDIEPTEEQKQELERRLREHEENPGQYISWEDLCTRIEESL